MSKVFEKTFDEAAEVYDRIRPDYPPEIFDAILSYQSLNSGSMVLEIGLGTGLATKPFLQTGCRLIGVEPGENLTQIALRKFQSYSNFSVCTQRLQEYGCPDESFDLIYAATSFHWLPEEYGYKRVFSLLKKGGAFARFRYHALYDKSRPELTDEIQACYKECMQRERPAEFGEDDAKAISELALKYGFTETEYRLFHTVKDFTADEYMALLKTYPDHMKLTEPFRSRLFDGIRNAIERKGGLITVYYTMDLELARKPLI